MRLTSSKLGSFFLQYAQDYDTIMPVGIRSASDSPTAISSGLGWASQIYPYIKLTSLYHCPVDAPCHYDADTMQVSYAYNRNIAVMNNQLAWTSPYKSVIAFEITGAQSPTDWPRVPLRRNSALSPVGDGTAVSLYDGQTSDTISLACGNVGSRPMGGEAWPSFRTC